MSINHRERVERVVDKALKEAALGEPYGFWVAPGHWPYIDLATGKEVGNGPALWITVTIRATGLGDPDLGKGYALPGVLPEDADIQFVAVGLFKGLLMDRERRDVMAVEQAKRQASMEAFVKGPQSESGLAVATKGQSK